MTNRSKSAGGKGRKSTFFILAAIVLLATVLCFTGLTVPKAGGGYSRVYSASEIRYGIDIRGGVEAVFAPADYDGKPSEADMAALQQVFTTRLDNLNILDREIIPNAQNGRITVRFPWKSDETEFNPDEAIQELGATAHLSFVGPDGVEIMNGTDVESAQGGVTQTGENMVILNLKESGTEKFAEATETFLRQVITIKMDDNIISSPVVRDVINTGEATISGIQTPEEAVTLAQQINAGALPFAIEAISSRSISPQLGTQALDVMIKAGLAAFVLLVVILLLRYRLSGFVAFWSLLAQVVGILLAIAIPQQTLTLQGIAGIILSIGMGVDANVITSERIHEEILGGTPIRRAVEIGYDKAFSSILDGNVTVAIAAICLIVFGSGTLLSFGYSLLVGVILNLICGAWLSHYMTRSLVRWEGLRKPGLFGVTQKDLLLSKEVANG